MRTKNVVVLESNVTLQQELKEAMESSEELRVVYAGDDGEAGIKQIQQLKPEMAIVGMFLKGTDGSVRSASREVRRRSSRRECRTTR